MNKNKLLVGIALLLILLVGGWFALMSDTNTTPTDEPTASEPTTSGPTQDGIDVANESINLTFTYADNAFAYNGTVQKPTPCHSVETDLRIMESFPEQVELDINVVPTDEICAQVIDEEELSGEITVSEYASIRVYLNGEVVDTLSSE